VTGSARVAVLALLALIPTAAAAALPAGLAIEASLDRQRVAVGQEAQVTVVAEAQGVALPEFAFPPVPGLHVVRAADSQNFSWVNGHLSRTSTSVFLMSASAPGRYTIPPIRIASGAARAQTSPLVLEVGGAPSSSSGGLPPAGGSGEPPPSKVWGDESLPELFVRFVVDRRQVYWNQQVTARFLFYTRERLEEPPMWEIAEAAGFWKEPLGEMRRGRVRVGNADYVAFEQDVAYFPTRTGKLKLGPGRVEARVMRRVDAPDPWSFLGFPETRVETIPLQTESASITVLPLPQGALPGFRGAVGQLVMDVKVDRLAARAGEPVTVTTVIRGEGNLNTAGDPDVAASLSLRSFESPATVTSTVAGYKIRGERRRDKAFVPEVPGRLSILPIRFTWFDPEERRYRTQVSDSIHVQVLPGGDSSAAAAGPPEPPAAPRRKSGPHGALDLGPPAGAIALGAGSIAALAAAAAIAGARRRAQLDPKRRRKDALARIEGEMAALRADDAARAAPGASAARAASLLTAALGVRYAADIEGRPREDALRILRNAGADAAILEEAARVLDELERLAFAPPGPDSGAIDRARALVRRLAEEKA
jgi:hypothetical protein